MDRAVDLVTNVVKAVRIPVTVTMRLGWDQESLAAPELAVVFEKAGVAGVIVHGRTREQGFSGSFSP
jgi:tRNA-dihydrouridine synthase